MNDSGVAQGYAGIVRAIFLQRLKQMRRHILALPAGFLLVFLFMVPVAILFAMALFDPVFTFEHVERFANSSAYLSVFRNSATVAAVVTVFCLVLGYPFAAFLVFQPEDKRYFWLFLALVPMWMSILIRSYAWMVVLGREGIVNSTLIGLGIVDAPLRLLHTTGAVYIAMVQILLPLMVVTCYAGMSSIDLTLVRAARVLGASSPRAFFGVFFPLSLNGAVSGSVVTFVLALAFFATPALLGGRKDMMVANVISALINQNNWAFAATLAIALLIMTLIILVLFYAASRMARSLLGS